MQDLIDIQAASKAAQGLADLARLIHQMNVRVGWWDAPRNFGELMALAHSELSEALEGHRKDLMDTHLSHRKMIEVELADCVIRICDTAQGLGYDLAGALVEKLEYNATREDHKREVRAMQGGKKY